jgi:hypothetical protein
MGTGLANMLIHPQAQCDLDDFRLGCLNKRRGNSPPPYPEPPMMDTVVINKLLLFRFKWTRIQIR